MIIILSEAQDVSSQKVMTWLNQFNQDIWCLNGSTFIDEIEIEGDKITINGLSLEKCSSIWDRRGNLSFQLSHSVFPKSILGNLCSSEWKILRDYLYFLFNEKGVGSFLHESAHNKFIDLHLAQKVGLSIPHSFVVSTKIKLAELLSRYELITKPLNDAKSVEYGGYHYENEGTPIAVATR